MAAAGRWFVALAPSDAPAASTLAPRRAGDALDPTPETDSTIPSLAGPCHPEARTSPRLRRCDDHVRLWRDVSDGVDPRQLRRGNLRQLPPVLHRQAEADGHRGSHRALPEEVRPRFVE